MANPERAGWFDDPDDPEQLRYFDGILWTDHVTPRRTHRESPAPAASSGQGSVGQDAPRLGSPYAAPPLPGAYTAHRTGPVTSDGVPMASYGMRVLAFIIDFIVVALASAGAGWPLLMQAIGPVQSAMEAALRSGDSAAVNAAFENLDMRAIGLYTAISLAVMFGYHVLCLVRWSATPGKLVCGISVRRAEHAGVLDLNSAVRRVGFVVALSAASNLPVIGIVATLARAADLVWPLRDPRRQTLHDKVADTVVVVGRQQRRR